MLRKNGSALAIIALSIYIIGGLGCFGGVALILTMKSRDLWGWGEGRSLGYLLLCVGMGFSILGVLFMRIFRNRGFS